MPLNKETKPKDMETWLGLRVLLLLFVFFVS